jgi:hypothetical protein
MLLTILFQCGNCITMPIIRRLYVATPSILFNFRQDPQKALPYVNTRVLATDHENVFSVRAVREPEKGCKKVLKKKKGRQRYISSVRGGVTPVGGMMKLGIFVEPSDVMNHGNFHLHMMNSLRASGGSKRGFAFEMHLALTTLPCATALAGDLI